MEHRDSSPTPEKQLLKLIEQPEMADQQKEGLKGKGTRLLSPGAIRGRISFFKQRVKSYLTAGKAPIGVKGVNRALGFCALVMAAYLAVDIVNAMADLNEVGGLEPVVQPQGGEPVSALPSRKEKPYYVEKVRPRDIFSFVSLAKPDRVETTPDLPAKKRPEQVMLGLMKGLKFRGMSVWPGGKTEVYIEDAVGKTHTLKVGGKINQLEVIKIFEDKVILRYEGIELPLIE